jgi:DNA-binding NtrC family response regulator
MSPASAEAGAQWRRSHQVDLVVLDIALSDTNGVGWLKELSEQGFSGGPIPITAFADPDTAIKAFRAGASDVILKPFRVPQILGTLQHGCERSSLRRDHFAPVARLSQ